MRLLAIKYNLKIVLGISVLLGISRIHAQSVTVEVGASKHFVANTENYEQPNLNIQFRYRPAQKFEYAVNYYNINTYGHYPTHPILPWNGDEKELYVRKVNGIDLTFNLLPIVRSNYNFGIGIGPTGRLRNELGFNLCQYTLGGWMECFYYSEKFLDFGVDIQGYFNYYLWKNLGLSAGVNERIYTDGPSAFSLNLGVIYNMHW